MSAQKKSSGMNWHFPPEPCFLPDAVENLFNWHHFETSKHFEDVLINVGDFCGFLCSLKMQLRVHVCMGPELVISI